MSSARRNNTHRVTQLRCPGSSHQTKLLPALHLGPMEFQAMGLLGLLLTREKQKALVTLDQGLADFYGKGPPGSKYFRFGRPHTLSLHLLPCLGLDFFFKQPFENVKTILSSEAKNSLAPPQGCSLQPGG